MVIVANIEDVKLRLKAVREVIRNDYEIDIYGIVGSFARGDFGNESDIDLVCKRDGHPSLRKLLYASDFLEKSLGRKVDFVFPAALPEYSYDYMMKDLVKL